MGRLRVAHVVDGGPARLAGILADDEIVALEGIRTDAEGLDGTLDRLDVGRAVEVHLFRRDELLRLMLTPTEPPRDTCYLTFDAEAGEAILTRQRQWLSAPPVSSGA